MTRAAAARMRARMRARAAAAAEEAAEAGGRATPKTRGREIRARILNDQFDTFADITDALANLRHLCDSEGIDYARVDRLAYQHYLAEKTEGL